VAEAATSSRPETEAITGPGTEEYVAPAVAIPVSRPC